MYVWTLHLLHFAVNPWSTENYIPFYYFRLILWTELSTRSIEPLTLGHDIVGHITLSSGWVMVIKKQWRSLITVQAFPVVHFTCCSFSLLCGDCYQGADPLEKEQSLYSHPLTACPLHGLTWRHDRHGEITALMVSNWYSRSGGGSSRCGVQHHPRMYYKYRCHPTQIHCNNNSGEVSRNLWILML